MKNLKLYIAVAVVSAGMALTSCGDSFLDPEPTTQGAAGAAGDPLNINSGLAASYQILGFDSYANGSYESSVFIGDIQSDDAWKGGGDANDGMNGMNLAVSMFNTSGNLTLSGTWNIYTSGITRVNSVLGLIETATTSNPAEVTLIKKYKAEALFLRAYYLYMLWRSFGAVPFQETLFEPPYLCRQLTPDEVYTQIIKDVDGSIENFTDAEMSTNDGTNDGRASLAAAYMLKARTVMYQKDQSKYQEAAKGLAAIIKSGKFTLVSDYAGMWLQEGEFGSESIFEANLVPGSKDWGTAWNSGGTNLPSYISPSELGGDPGFAGGWGFCPARPEAYEMFEKGDQRRDASIRDLRGDATGGKVGEKNTTPWGAKYTLRFQDTGFWMAKYCARTGYHKPTGTGDLNWSNNLRIFRYAETLLAYAELTLTTGDVDGVSGVDCLNKVRDRAFGNQDHRVALTLENIQKENHLEFVGEGHRYYDVVRWGITNVLHVDNVPGLNTPRDWKEHNKYVAIPQGDIDATKGTEYELKQNPGY